MAAAGAGRRPLALVVAALAVLAAGAGLVLADRDGRGPAERAGGSVTSAAVPRVLVFSKTAGFRHPSIEHATAELAELGTANGFEVVDAGNDATAFTPANLAGFAAVVWLSTTENVLDDVQQAAFEGYIRAGGGYVGIHAASDTEYGWPWYGELVGAWFDVHPSVQPATVRIEDAAHPSTAGLPAAWARTDEWYDFKRNPRAVAHVLATLDETTYTGGGMGVDHPIAWCRVFDGGRSWYTAGGHPASAFDEALFRQHLVGGIQWAAGMTTATCGAAPNPPPPSTTTPTTTTPTIPPGPGPGPGTGSGGDSQADAARFIPVPPSRVLDTRIGLGAPSGPLASDGVLDVVVAGQAGVPAEAVAVALTVTATDATGAGYVTAWPSGALRPTASNLNLERPGQTIAGLAVVRLGAAGAVSLYAQTATHLVADVAGYWVASGATRAGRFVAVDPARLVDTREGTGAPRAPLASGSELAVTVAGQTGLPGAGVGAVVLNVTATGATGPGYLTVWPGGERPLVSNLNVEVAGQTIPNAVVVPVGADGRVHLFAQTATDVVVDVAGWFTGPDAPSSTEGLYVAMTPKRLLDTRTMAAVDGVFGAAGLTGGTGAELAVAGAGGVPATGVAAVVATVTGTQAAAAGFVTVSPAGRPRPTASNLNLTAPGQTIANLAVARLGTAGRVALYAQSTVELAVDVSGWFTGPPSG